MFMLKQAKEIAGAMAGRAFSAVASLRPKSTQEKEEDAALAEALLYVKDHAGWKRLMEYLHERRDALLKSAMHDKNENRDAQCERAAELDAVFRWIDNSISLGVEAKRKLEEA